MLPECLAAERTQATQNRLFFRPQIPPDTTAPWFSPPDKLLLSSTEQHRPKRGHPRDGAELLCCCIYPPALGICCLTQASPACSKSFGFYLAWWELDGGSTRPQGPRHGRAFWKNTYWKIGTEHDQRRLFSLSTFLVYFVAFYNLMMNPNCSQGIWRGRLKETGEASVGHWQWWDEKGDVAKDSNGALSTLRARK